MSGRGPETMKTAKAMAQSVTLDCPHCGEPMLTAAGALVWHAEDFTERELAKCKSDSCGMTCWFPSTATTNAGSIGSMRTDDYFDDPIGQVAS